MTVATPILDCVMCSIAMLILGVAFVLAIPVMLWVLVVGKAFDWLVRKL